MPKVKILRPVVVQGRARYVGEVLDVTDQDVRILGNRAEVVDAPLGSEPETATNTTAEHASLIAGARTAKRK